MVTNTVDSDAMAEAAEESNQGVTRTLKDLFGGAVGGVAQVLIGTVFMCINMSLTRCLGLPFETLHKYIC